MKKIMLDNDMVEQQIASEEYVEMGNKSVICLLITKCGYEVSGHSSPLNIEDYNVEIGKQCARKRAFDALFNNEAYSAMVKAIKQPEQLPEDTDEVQTDN